MLPLDASALYGLPEAGRRLFADPVLLRRLARRRRIPSLSAPEGLRLPRTWVDAEAGIDATDPEGLRLYWLERLAPAEPEAVRPKRDRTQLPPTDLLDAPEAARRLTADAAFLRRLDAEGVLPGLQVDGVALYDATLVDLLAREDDDEEAGRLADARRVEIHGWARHAWVSDLDTGAAGPPAATRPAPRPATAAAPHAWHIPADIADLQQEAPAPSPPREGLIEADGFETAEED